MAIGKSVRNVFDLVHHFGNEEDQISANFGFILSINRQTVLLDFLKRLDIDTRKVKKKDIKNIDLSNIHEIWKGQADD
jgi:hypothetical protein